MENLIEGLRRKAPSWEIRLFTGGEDLSVRHSSALEYVYSKKQMHRLLDTLKEFNPEVVHLFNYYHLLSPSVLDALLLWKMEHPSVRVIYTAHDFHLVSPSSGLTTFKGSKLIRSAPQRFPAGVRGWGIYFRKWDVRGFLYSTLKLLQWVLAYRWGRKDRVFDLLIAPGEFMLATLQKACPGKEVVLVRNPMPSLVLRQMEPARRDRNLRIVFLGRLGPEKGLLPFLSGISRELWAEITVDIYGEGEERTRIEKFVEREGLGGSCVLCGALPHDRMVEKLPSYHAMVLPSLCYENAPLSVVEGALAGLYLIVSAWGGVADTARLCGGAIEILPEDPESVSAGVRECLEQFRKTGSPERELDKLSDYYSEELFIDRHIELYLARESTSS